MQAILLKFCIHKLNIVLIERSPSKKNFFLVVFCCYCFLVVLLFGLFCGGEEQGRVRLVNFESCFLLHHITLEPNRCTTS